MSRAIAFFSGTVGLVMKLTLLGISNALAVWAAAILVGRHSWLALGVLLLATAAIDAVFFGGAKAVPAKFLAPGLVFLVAFQIVPIVYTARVAFTNYSTGHIFSKAEAIKAIQNNTLQPAQNGAQYTMAPATDASGKLVLLLVDETTNKAFIGTTKGLTPAPAGALKIQGGLITGATGYKLLTGSALAGTKLDTYLVPIKGGAIEPQGLSQAVALEPTLRYDPATGTFTRLTTGTVFHDNGKGSFVAANGEELEPGWTTDIGLSNFKKVVKDKTVRTPFLRVFAWTMVYAAGSVLLTFVLGLLLAVVLDKPGMRFQRSYRSLLVIPYAIPSFLSALVWAGLLNDDFGIVNRTLGIHVPRRTSVPPHESPVKSIANATGAATFNCAYGTSPVSSNATTIYSTVQIASEPRMPIGISRCGFLASCAAVDTASNPIYAKKITAAPRATPDHPKVPKAPLFGGMNGVQL